MKRLTVLVAILGLVAVACGGSADTEGVASLSQTENETATVDADPEVDAEDAFLAFTACMRDEGVDLPDPQTDEEGNFFFEGRPGGDDLAPGELRTAGENCGHHLEGVTQIFRDFDRTEIEDELYEFATCMRENGYDMPDPDFSALGPGSDEGDERGPGAGPFGELDQDDPAFQTAVEACQEVLGGLRGPGGRPGGPGGDA